MKKEAGEKLIGYRTSRWLADKRAFIETGVGGQGSDVSFWAYDRVSKQIKLRNVDSAGSVLDAVVWKESADKWAFRMTGSIADGRKQKGSGHCVFSKDGNSYALKSDVSAHQNRC